MGAHQRRKQMLLTLDMLMMIPKLLVPHSKVYCKDKLLSKILWDMYNLLVIM